MNKIVYQLRRRLNGRGIALPEVFFAFLILISLSVILVNFFMPRTNTMISVKSYEADYDATLRATVLAVANSAVDLNGEKELWSLTGYVPVIDYSQPNKLFLLNIVDANNNLIPYANKFEIINRYRFGYSSASIKRNDVIDLRNYNLNTTTYSESFMNGSNLGQIPSFDSDKVLACYKGTTASCPSHNYYISLSKEYMNQFDRISDTRGIIYPRSDGRATSNEYSGNY